jgi:hypothetical protein
VASLARALNTASKEPPGLDDGCHSAQKKTTDLCPVSMGVAWLLMLIIAAMTMDFLAGVVGWCCLDLPGVLLPAALGRLDWRYLEETDYRCFESFVIKTSPRQNCEHKSKPEKKQRGKQAKVRRFVWHHAVHSRFHSVVLLVQFSLL